MNQLSRVLTRLLEGTPVPFPELLDQPDQYYAVWVDAPGAEDLSRLAAEPIEAGVIYVGECVKQSPRRHLSHRDIGSFTLMKNLAAVFRREWDLRATARGSRLLDPGREQLRTWMAQHLAATTVGRHPDVTTKQVLAWIDPPLRIEGWRPERTPLREQLTAERAMLDRDWSPCS